MQVHCSTLRTTLVASISVLLHREILTHHAQHGGFKVPRISQFIRRLSSHTFVINQYLIKHYGLLPTVCTVKMMVSCSSLVSSSVLPSITNGCMSQNFVACWRQCQV